MSMQEYIDHPYDGSSSLKKILMSPADYKAAKEQKGVETYSLSLGTAIHSVVLESEEFNKTYACQPEDWGPKNKGDGYKKWKEFKAENTDMTCLGWEEAQLLSRVNQAAFSNEELQTILNGAQIEVTGLDHSNKLKARADIIDKHGRLWDLKSTSQGMDDKSLMWTCFKMGYHFQAAHHKHVFKNTEQSGHIWISTDTPAVHIRITTLSDAFYQAGRQDFEYALGLRDGCQLAGNWPTNDSAAVELDYPFGD